MLSPLDQLAGKCIHACVCMRKCLCKRGREQDLVGMFARFLFFVCVRVCVCVSVYLCLHDHKYTSRGLYIHTYTHTRAGMDADVNYYMHSTTCAYICTNKSTCIAVSQCRSALLFVGGQSRPNPKSATPQRSLTDLTG